MQLTRQQRVFLVTASRGCDPKVIKSFLKNVQKTSLKEMFRIKQQFGKMSKSILTKVLYSLNLNRGRSGRRRTVRSEKNIANVRQLLHDDAHVTGRRNPLQIS